MFNISIASFNVASATPQNKKAQTPVAEQPKPQPDPEPKQEIAPASVAQETVIVAEQQDLRPPQEEPPSKVQQIVERSRRRKSARANPTET